MADLKLIAAGIDLYTINQVTSEAAGFEMEFMQDRKLSTSWKADSTDLQNIDIDTGDDNFAAAYFFLYHNISDNSSAATIKIYKEDEDDGTWDGSFGQVGSTFTITPSNTPYALISFEGSTPNRHWRIEIDGSDVAPEVYLVFFGSEGAAVAGITLRYMFGQLEEPIYDGSKIIETPGGIRYSRQYYDGRDRFEYAWDHLDSGNEAKLQLIAALSKGRALPFFMQDINSAYHYVRLMNSGIGSRQVAHTLFNTGRLIFEEEL